jgi:hypothetical protein
MKVFRLNVSCILQNLLWEGGVCSAVQEIICICSLLCLLDFITLIFPEQYDLVSTVCPPYFSKIDVNIILSSIHVQSSASSDHNIWWWIWIEELIIRFISILKVYAQSLRMIPYQFSAFHILTTCFLKDHFSIILSSFSWFSSSSFAKEQAVLTVLYHGFVFAVYSAVGYLNPLCMDEI